MTVQTPAVPWTPPPVPVPDAYRDPDYALLPDGRRAERLADMLRARAAATPDVDAVLEVGRTTSWAELDRTANRVAQALARDGVRAGDRVAYVGANAPSFLAVLFGAAKLGAVPAPLNALLAAPELSVVLGDARPAVLVVGAGSGAAAAAATGSTRVVAVDEGVPGAVHWDTWLDGVEDTDPGVVVDPGDTAVLFFSSGTTGRPKGIELTGANLGQALAASSYLLDLDVHGVAMAPIPFFHVAGIGLALAAVLGGTALLLEAPTDLAGVAELWQRRKVTHAVAVPTVLQMLLQLPAVREADWSTLQYVIYGASPIPVPVLTDAAEVFGCRFLQSYGLTESTGGITMLMPEDHRPDPADPVAVARLRSVGRPMPGVPVRVVDPVTLEDLPPGQRGEVLIGGGHVMKGYWERPEDTAAAVLPGGWLRTGDGGSFDEGGYLFLHDRLKDMIITGGENVFPAEVESVLTGHPGVVEVAVVGVPSQRWGESPHAVVVPRDPATFDPDQLLTWARERLAHYKCPVGVTVVGTLPRNASGKLLKRQLRADLAG
ncbi:AMP-binding protein [Klenkia sp. PcliD-1-E]|uniref:AMP-binding protein n=1 Tax=Klenkia sp. PcliD-1-E TaxID=2954492 RepID=UPI002096FA68|nr:AMP-binding protein [Klenkia sp. PcliD-1-E]MCO7220126.1 AMP-binding protein [Klenkia sp. PcliD-1-E]